MEQYISKSAVVAEIENRKRKLLDHIIIESDKEWAVRTAHQLNRIIWFINTLEVKEVDLEKETKKWWKERLHLNPENQLWMDAHQSVVFAKHFFELGIRSKATKASEFLKKHFEETSQEELDKEWKEIEPLNNVEPDVLEYADKVKKHLK